MHYMLNSGGMLIMGHKNELSRRAFVTTSAVLGGFVLTSSGLALPKLAVAETAAEKQAEADGVRNQLVGLQADLETAAENYYSALDSQEAAQQSMEEEQAKIDEASDEISGLQENLSTRARSMYRSGSATFIDFLLGATSFSEFTQNWTLLNQINEGDATLVSETKQAREQLQNAKDEYARQEQIAATKAAEAKTIRDDVQTKVASATELVNSLDAEAQKLLEEEQAAAAAAQAAAEEAARKAAEEEAAKQSAAQASSSASSSSDYSDSGSSGSTVVYSSGSSSSSGGSSTADCSSVVDYAMSRIGCPYVWGAEGPDSFDCSGLVTWSYRQVGISLPHQSESQRSAASNIVSVSEARPGDVLWRYGHVGIAVRYGGSHYVHAPTFGAYVRDTDSLSWSNFTAALQF